MIAENHYLQESFYDLLCNDPQVQEFFKNESIDGIWYFDPAKKEDIWVTVPFLKCLGYSPADFDGQVLKWNSIVDPSDNSFFYRLYANQLKAGIQSRLSDWVYLIHQNGQAIPFTCKCILVDNNQKLLGIVKRIKPNTVFNESKGVSIADLLHLTNQFFILDTQFQFESLLAYDAESLKIKERLIGKNFHQIGFPQEISNTIEEHLKKAFNSNEKQELEFILTLEHKETWLKLVTSIWKEDAIKDRLLCIFQNHTTKHQEELDHYKQFKALENSIDGVAFLSTEGFCSYVNQGFATMMGQTKEDLIGLHWRKVLMANEVKKFDAEIIPSLYSKGVYVGNINGSRKNGEIFPVSISLTVTVDFGIICVLRDLSEIEHMKVEISEKDKLLLQFIKEVPSATYLVEESVTGEINFAFTSDDFKQNFPHLLDQHNHLQLELLLKFLHPDDLLPLKNLKNHSKTKSETFTLELRIKDNHHSYNWYKIKAQPVSQDNGSFIWYGTIVDISDKKLAQSQLLPLQEQVVNSESKYETLLSASQLGGWEYNKNTKELWCSHAYFEMLGLAKEYPARWGNYQIKEVWEDLLHPEDLPIANQYFRNYLENLSGTYSQEFRMKHANGSWIWISSRGNAILDAKTSQPNGIVIGAHINITQMRESQRAEKINQKRYSALFNGAQDAIFIAEATTGILVDMNQQAEELMGYPKEFLIGKHQTFLHPEKELSSIQEKFAKLALSEERTEVESCIKQKSGNIIPVSISAGEPFEVEGKIYASGYFRDLSKITEARFKIDSMENLLSRAEGIANVGSEEIKLANGEHVWSDVLYRILGLKPKSILPKRSIFVNLIHQDDRQKYLEWFANAITSRMPSDAIEVRIVDMTGTEKHLLISSINQLNEDGEIMSHFGVFKDISEITNTIKELQQQNKQLKEIAWSQSHLVRAPLSRLLGLTQVFQKGILSKEEEKEFLKHIHQTTIELDQVITNIIYTANGLQKDQNQK